ncbi:MAG: hypothetical protein JWM40_2284, partial [Frankiales bacterium]|nr:hypothetical protein [Frankiales bacterium]
MPGPTRSRAVIGLVLAAATACGTTVPTSGLSASGALDDGLGGPTSAGATAGQAPGQDLAGAPAQGLSSQGP